MKRLQPERLTDLDEAVPVGHRDHGFHAVDLGLSFGHDHEVVLFERTLLDVERRHRFRVATPE